MDGPQPEARPCANDRVPAELRVRRFGELSHEYQSVNLSEGGVFVATNDALPPGTWVELGVQLGGRLSTTEIVSSAQVMWSNDAHTPSSPSLPAGMGLRFVGLDQDSRTALRSYVKRLRTEKTRRTTVRQPAKKQRRSSGGRAELLSPGDQLGKYCVVDVLGVGGMGTVYLAEQTRIGRPVAIKKLHRRYTRDAVAAQRFFDEARLVNRIGHPNIVEVFDFVSEGRDHYFVMELLDGCSLGALIAEDAPLSAKRIVAIGRQLCNVLHAVHAHDVVHRDLKPDNIFLIRRCGNPDFVKLLDFGIAKLRAPVEELQPAQTAAGVVLGTPGYLAPESIAGEPVDARCDIYALGVILFQLAAGRMPFSGPWGQVVVKQATETPPCPNQFRTRPLPAALDELILRCLAADPKARPQSVADLHDHLTRATGHLTPQPRRRWPHLRATALGIVGIAAIALSPALEDAPPLTRRTSAPAPASMKMATPALDETRVAPTPPKRSPKRKRLTPRKRYRRAEALLDRGDAAVAAVELERVVRARPYHAHAHRALGKAYLLLGRDADGFAALATYVELVPNAPDAARLRELVDAFRRSQ